jgi:hypothetical protein
MNKGFTLKSFLIVLGLIVLMALIAFFVQRKEKEPLPVKDETTEESSLEEIAQSENENYENENYQDSNNGNEKIINHNEEITDHQKIEKVEVDCGKADYLALKVKQDLSSRLGVSINQIKTIGCLESYFSDYTLGTSGPGEIYPQELTFGYIITLLFNEQEYRYHVNDETLLFVN